MSGEQIFETDRWGNPICGQDFMAGTICTMVPGHPGPHAPLCQNCDGDWYDETCTCEQPWRTCAECGERFDPNDEEAGWGDHCWACACDHIGEHDFGAPYGVGEAQCLLVDGHAGPHQYTQMPVTDEEIAAAVASIQSDMPAIVIVFKDCIDCGKSIGCTMGGDPPTCKTHN